SRSVYLWLANAIYQGNAIYQDYIIDPTIKIILKLTFDQHKIIDTFFLSEGLFVVETTQPESEDIYYYAIYDIKKCLQHMVNLEYHSQDPDYRFNIKFSKTNANELETICESNGTLELAVKEKNRPFITLLKDRSIIVYTKGKSS